MRAKITALVLSGLVLSGALLAGAQGTAAAGTGATVMWQNKQLRVTERVEPLRLTFKNKIAHAIRFRCRYLQDTEWVVTKSRLRPLEKRVIWPANALTASQFSCRTRLAG
jgi:hypothetical protein